MKSPRDPQVITANGQALDYVDLTGYERMASDSENTASILNDLDLYGHPLTGEFKNDLILRVRHD